MSIVTAPSIEISDRLFSLYKAMPGHTEKSMNDFYTFLTTPSASRDEFLSRYTECEFIVSDQVVVKKHKEK